MKEWVIGHILRSVLLINNLAEISYELLFEHVGDFSALKEAIVKHGLRDGHTNLSAELHNLVDVDFPLVLETQGDEVVVIIQANVDPVRFMMSIVKRREDLDLGRRVLFGIRILQDQEGCQRGATFTSI